MYLTIDVPTLDNPTTTLNWLEYMAEEYQDTLSCVSYPGGIDELVQLLSMSIHWSSTSVIVLPGYTKNWNSSLFGGAAAMNEVGVGATSLAGDAMVEARDKHIPVFGICGGAQLVAWSNGGPTRKLLSQYVQGPYSVDVPHVEEYTKYWTFPAVFDHGVGIHHHSACIQTLGWHYPSTDEACVSAFFSKMNPLQGGVQYHPENAENLTTDKASRFAYEMIRYLSAKRQGLELISEEI